MENKRKIKSSFFNEDSDDDDDDDDDDDSEEKFDIDNFPYEVDYLPFVDDSHDPLYNLPTGFK